jgi:3-dehydroquinate dehydratase/shikimate dehydrogenase
VAKICLCLTAKTIERDLEILNKYRKYTDLAELRVDCLDPNERLFIRRFPEQAGLPVILTIRRDIDGGFFTGGDGARVHLFARGLAFAEADRRRNFAYVDIEEDLNVPSLEEAVRTFGTRIIRSYHSIQGTDENISAKLRNMVHSGDELVKVAITARSTEDALRMFRAGKECAGLEKILICMGHYGIFTRILAEKFGSFLTYADTISEPDSSPGAAGQLDVRKLAELYRFRNIAPDTRVYGMAGFPLKTAASPYFFNTVFGLENINAVYVPFPVDSISCLLELAEEMGVSGLTVAAPYKEAVIPFLAERSSEARAVGACNFLSRCAQGWLGSNTDIRGFSSSLLDFTGTKTLKWRKVTIVGAGGAARAAAFEVHRLGAKALILNRTTQRARALALPYQFAWGGLDSRGIDMIDKYADIIIQATSAGMEGGDTGDPLEMYNFSGREAVMDLIYGPEPTPFLRRAAAAGCRVIDGYDMLTYQARCQYARFMGKEFPERLLSRIQLGGAYSKNGPKSAAARK